MFTNVEFGGLRQEAFVVCFRALVRQLSEGTEENYEVQSRWWILGGNFTMRKIARVNTELI
jgi:hypothetical protein